jgi:hypothetical protein
LEDRISISKPTATVRFEGIDAGEPAFSRYLDTVIGNLKLGLA